MQKKYVCDRGEKCPTCKKGKLIQVFYLKSRPLVGPAALSNTPRIIPRTVESREGVFCDNTQCGQCFVRPGIGQEKTEEIFKVLSEEVILIGYDTETIFPEELVDQIIPVTAFPHMKTLEILGNAMGKEIRTKEPVLNTEEVMLDNGFEKKPDEILYSFFEIVSEIEKQLLAIRFKELKEDFRKYESSVQDNKEARLEELRLKKSTLISKGTQVKLTRKDSAGYLVQKVPLVNQRTYIPITIVTGELKDSDHFIAKQPVLIYERGEGMMDMKEFWPENIIFE